MSRAEGFPALIASASLKQQRFAIERCSTAVFSGAYCVGLIEARFALDPNETLWEFSGAYCVGLIEARYPSDRVMPTAMFSGAYCVGLIEACRARACRRADWPVFRRLLRRPH